VDSRGKWYLKAKSYYSFGTTLHKVLERFHDSGDTGVTTVGDALRIYEESWIDAGYGSAEEMQEAYGEGKEIVEVTIGKELERDPNIVTLAVEKMLTYDMGAFSLIGRIDRLDQHPDGSIEIIDYKSGRGAITTEQVESDLAMACYQLMVRRANPDSNVFATIHALKAGQKATASLSDSELDQFENDIRELGSQILGTTIEDHVPAYKPICTYCDFQPLCRKHPDFDIPAE
jgi:putative RecB family exonuclease